MTRDLTPAEQKDFEVFKEELQRDGEPEEKLTKEVYLDCLKDMPEEDQPKGK